MRGNPTAAMAIFLVALVLLVVAYAEALFAWVRLWLFAGLDYGLVILGVASWLLWRARARLAAAPRAPDWRALWLLVPVCLAGMLAFVLDIRIVQYAVFVVGLAALVWAVLGQGVLRWAVGPIAFLLLAVPFWNYLGSVLQAMTVHATALALEITGTPVFVDQTYLYTPHGTLLVLGRCSGVQFFQAGATLGAFYAYLASSRVRTRLLVIADFVICAIVGNWIRVYALVFMPTLTGQQHFVFGWALFGSMLIPAFWLATRLLRTAGRSRQESPANSHSRQTMAPAAATAVQSSLANTLTVAAVALVLLGAGPALGAAVRVAPERVSLQPMSAQVPWSGPLRPPEGWKPVFGQFDAEAMAAYHAHDREVVGYWAYYVAQRRGSEVINTVNTVYDPAHWRPRGGYEGTDYSSVALEGDAPLAVIETRLENLHERTERLVWHWYRVGGRDVAYPWQAKYAQLLGLLQGRRDAMVVVLSTDGRDVHAARDLLREFVTNNRIALTRTPELTAAAASRY